VAEFESDPVLTVMTANLWNGLAPDTRVIHAIRSSGADLIGLEELNQRQAVVVADAVADLYPHAATFGDSFEGRGVLSKFPLMAVEMVPIVPDRPDVRALIEIAGIPVTMIVGHPRPQMLRRGRLRFQMASLRQIIRLGQLTIASAPAILLGDFNMGPKHPGYARLARLGLTDAYVAAGATSREGNTFPLRVKVIGPQHDPTQSRIMPMSPIKRFDHIWHTPDISTERAWIGPDSGSDHASVVARLILPQPAAGNPSEG
jgi:endonuclease/exonuclease/phosphatase (EEP) superfamily protein YafD